MKDTPLRIALFGGTFDPVHLGHIRMAQAAKNALSLNRVILIPCTLSPHKTIESAPAPGDSRMDMLRIVCRDHPWMDADGCELEREGVSYSWQTAEDFRNRYPDARLFWIMGEDQWLALPRWSRPEYVAELVEFIVFGRNDRTPVSREGMKAHFLPAVHQASATEIRDALRSGLTSAEASKWVTPQVMQYICEKGLYGTFHGQ